MRGYNVAVVGATGAVGQEIIKILEERDFPVKELVPMASCSSMGKYITFKGEKIEVKVAEKGAFTDIDVAFFSAGGDVSRELAPAAVGENCVVIDNSNAWRMDPAVPLVVPEINPEDLDYHKGIIANPNCSTIQMLMAIKPIHDEYKVKRIVVSTYQSVSGTGQAAIDELYEQTKSYVNGEEISCNVYPYQIAYNVLPHIDVFLDNGYTMEEMKMVNETKKILDKDIEVTATTVRVPIFRCHSESINIETEKPFDLERVYEILKEAPGVVVVDEPSKNLYPLAIHCAGKDEVFVGRIRRDFTIPNGLNMWVVSDNLRKGAALNAIQIGEEMIKRGLI